MFYVYVLRSLKDEKLDIGYTPNLKKRFAEHNQGNVLSTKSRKPLNIIFYEAFLDKNDALAREKFLKTGWGRRHLKHALNNTLKQEN